MKPKQADGPNLRKLSQRNWTVKTLQTRPHLNRSMELKRRDNGTGLATIPMRKPGYMVPPLSWILPFSSVRRVDLDRLGMRVLNVCDGNRTVEEIIENFAVEYKLSFREAQLPVMQFLRQLTDRGIVALIGL